MAPLFFELKNENIKPDNTITLEIALASLKNVPETDASYIPVPDHWRANVSSCLWDDVVLHFHGEVSINRIIPFVDYKDQQANIRFDLNQAADFKGKADLQIIDKSGNVLIKNTQSITGYHNAIDFAINNKLKSWSPDHPNLYYLKLIVSDSKDKIQDQSTISFGIKSFEVKDKHFYLNAEPFMPKGTTIGWHRWMRTQEGRELAYDTAWFSKNILQRTKDIGVNYMRFHLGLPPERFLDLCDRYGLIVQYEWSFFHGMPASKESLLEQYGNWLDLAMRHPSVSLIHPYNETESDQLKTAWAALDELLVSYPPLVIEDRDVMHIHKYWWSLFENLGLYYDNSAHVILTSLITWNKLAKGDSSLSNTLHNAILQGKSVVMLDVGDRNFGLAYPKQTGDLAPSQGVEGTGAQQKINTYQILRVTTPQVYNYHLFGGINLKFTETAEPESHLHPDNQNRELWNNLPDEYTRLWKGLRGGLIVPAVSMELSGLRAKAFIAQWVSRGADEEKIKVGPYFAYELQGFYAFSDKANDLDAEKKLKDKINFLIQDAPALAIALNPQMPVVMANLNKAYRESEKGIADNLVPLANCGKNLTQTPVVMVDFGHEKGKLIVSQLLTSGRLAKGFGESGLYGIRYDEVAAQYVLNMIGLSLKK